MVLGKAEKVQVQEPDRQCTTRSLYTLELHISDSRFFLKKKEVCKTEMKTGVRFFNRKSLRSKRKAKNRPHISAQVC